MKRTLIAGCLGLVVFAGGLSSAWSQETEVAPLPKLVKLLAIAEEGDIQTRQFFGQIVARETVDLAFQVGGQIAELPVVEGAELTEGDLIARLDLEPFELVLERARLQSEQAERLVERLQSLSANTVSRVTVEDAVTAAQLAEVAVRNAEFDLEHATLLAPFDGIVASRSASNYATVSAGAPIVRVHDMSEFRVDIDVPELLFRRAGVDPNVEIVAMFPGDERVFPLEIREFNAEASRVGQTFRLTLAMERPVDLPVFPGSSVTVIARLIRDDTRIPIPVEALIAAPDDQLSVLIFEPTGADVGTVRLTKVVVEPDDAGGFVLLSGLEAGQEIVAAGGASLSDGETVRRFVAFPN